MAYSVNSSTDGCYPGTDTEELMMATIYAAQGITTQLRGFFAQIIE